MIDFRKEFKAVLWSDFERGDIDEYTMQRYFYLMDGKDNKYIQGLYDSYHVLMLNRLSIWVQKINLVEHQSNVHNAILCNYVRTENLLW